MSYASDAKQRALQTLDSMQTIVAREALVRGTYVTEVVRPDLAGEGAICGGRRACAIGALWLAHGEQPIYTTSLCTASRARREGWVLKGAVVQSWFAGDDAGRDAFLAGRPALRLAYEAMNQASYEYAQNIGGLLPRHRAEPEEGWMERLFELTDDESGEPALPVEYLLEVIPRAKQLIASDAVGATHA